MAEKGGNTEKLRYDFPTEAVLEIWMDKLDRWHRVTSMVFRSYDGPRQYRQPIQQPKHGMSFSDVPMRTVNFTDGPVYMSLTNREVYYKNTQKIIDSTKSLEFRKRSGSRG
jgi:hypothetical protein|tara:strand:+ start:537 stop:869 length:333 start_codon:yes stop_codon:yes gene_type:complete